MEHPIKEVRGVIQSLCQGTPQEQEDAVYRYFLPSASFVHPFCRVPSFEKLRVPGYGELDSRAIILSILKWCKPQTSSRNLPNIEIEVESTVFDQRASLLYVTSNQTFSLWFVPFHKAPIRLVTVLHLVETTPPAEGGEDNNGNQEQNRPLLDSNGSSTDNVELEELSYAEVLSAPPGTCNTCGFSAANAVAERTKTKDTSSSSTATPAGTQYKIQRQEDFYQVNEFLKFLFMAPGAAVWGAWQLFSTLMCVISVLLLEPLMRIVGPPLSRKSLKKA
ncbi:hypothetical protein B0H63DRAFT_539404 [Podospora didyma]|uniref:SigF-like NTF2-like domain-containing protein n=1 Tax=Podospora didyma TaxID=330526 RepID=A0AAE0U4W3_9PEZI|nr:hypothetical protein B0H63DRAFT_539404 [Podospora didyma]